MMIGSNKLISRVNKQCPLDHDVVRAQEVLWEEKAVLELTCQECKNEKMECLYN